MPYIKSVERIGFKRGVQEVEKRGEKKANVSLPLTVRSRLAQRSSELPSCEVVTLKAFTILPFGGVGDELPIFTKKTEIISAIRKNNVLIISGETGSGKTTQIPKFCLEAGRGVHGRIGCTQPRRIAATTIALRIAEELGQEVGQSVGYKIRFQEKIGRNTRIKIMTDGILLAETQADPRLSEYDTIIVDEAHERSLNIDFILGYLKTLLKKRRNLKLIITSATIDTEKFSKAFDNAPVIEVSGRMYPVDVRYAPLEIENEQTHIEAAVKAVCKIHQENPFGGDILVFMPTEADIRETCELLDGQNFLSVTIMPLYARLSGGDQSRVFSSISTRKIIVATNIAETSITIPGIKYVVDTGLARISQYTPRTRTTALPVMPISRSSADQRKGRCGRVANGICIRLYSEEDYLSRPLFTLSEILRSNLAEVILRMIALNLGDISKFPFIDRPAPGQIKDGFNLLVELGAITDPNSHLLNSPPNPPLFEKERGARGESSEKDRGRVKNRRFELTEKGQLMAKMPLDPRLSRMLIEAQAEGCVSEVAVIAAALSIQDPRERPAEKQDAADKAHAIFKDTTSDFATLINIWNKYNELLQNVKSVWKTKQFCKDHFLSFRRMREWRDIHAQISDQLPVVSCQKDSGQLSVVSCQKNSGQLSVVSDQKSSDHLSTDHLPTDHRSLTTDHFHKSILSGFLSNIAVKKEKNIFTAAKGREVMIFPGSGLFKNPPTWIVAAEMVETSRVFARTVAGIDPDWIEPLGKGLCKYQYIEPHWERSRGEVVAYEQVSLYGLVIVPRRPVSYGKIDPDESCSIFIQSALVEGDIRQLLPFMIHNRQCIEEVQKMEDRLRRRDILISDADIYDFYRQRLEGIYDIRTLKHYLKTKGGDDVLRMKPQDLLRYMPDEAEISMYPDYIKLGSHKVSCNYKFDPGKPDDGVTVKISSDIAPTVPPESLEWLVPGLLKEKIFAMIKGLPKEYRKKLVPVANTVAIIENHILKETPPEKRNKSLSTTLSSFICRHFGIDIPASAWNQESLSDHLRMRISVIDSKGREQRSGRDPAILRQRIEEPSDGFGSAAKAWEKTNITKWDFGDIPETIPIFGKNGEKWIAYPGLKPADNYVDLRLFPVPQSAEASHKKGVAVLLELHFSKDLKFLKRSLFLTGELKRCADYFGGTNSFEKQIYKSIIKTLFYKNIRTQNAFYAYAAEVQPIIISTGKAKLERVSGVLKATAEFRSTIYELEQAHKSEKGVVSLFQELREELSRLVPENFPQLYNEECLINIERYIRAMIIRAQRAVISIAKDQAKSERIHKYQNHLNTMLKKLPQNASEQERAYLEEFFWMIEEYKVSIFAQELKTAIPISPKKLDQKLMDLCRMFK